MFFTAPGTPVTLKVDQGETVVDLPFVQSAAGEWQVEIDEGTVIPLQDMVIQVDDQPEYPAVGFPDGDVLPLYCSMAKADRYFLSRLHGEIWTTYDLSIRAKSLVQATSTIDSLPYSGCLLDPNQLLEFPRSCSPVPWQATAELAFSLATGITLESRVEKLRVTSRRFSGVSTTLAPVATPSYLEAGVVSIAAWKLLEPYFQYKDGSVRLYRAS